jgi:hypothetical protein
MISTLQNSGYAGPSGLESLRKLGSMCVLQTDCTVLVIIYNRGIIIECECDMTVILDSGSLHYLLCSTDKVYIPS